MGLKNETAMMKMGPKDASHVVWALGVFVFVFLYLFYINLFVYMYPPTRLWGTGLRGVQKVQPVPQPQVNP